MRCDEMFAQKRRLTDCWRWGTPLARIRWGCSGQQIWIGNETLVVALGGNALLQRGEALTAKEIQYRNIAGTGACAGATCPLIGWR